MSKSVVGLVVMTALGISAILVQSVSNASSIKSTSTISSTPIVDWSKLEPTVDNLLAKSPTPRSAGYTLTDTQGNKQDCHRLFDTHKNTEGDTVQQWACWSKQ